MKKAEKINKLVEKTVAWENEHYNWMVRRWDDNYVDDGFHKAEEEFFREYEGYDKYSRYISDAIRQAEEENKSFAFIKEMADYWRYLVERHV
jgi:hypothetical protein